MWTLPSDCFEHNSQSFCNPDSPWIAEGLAQSWGPKGHEEVLSPVLWLALCLFVSDLSMCVAIVYKVQLSSFLPGPRSCLQVKRERLWLGLVWTIRFSSISCGSHLLTLTRNPRPNCVFYPPLAHWLKILGTCKKRRFVFLSQSSQPSRALDKPSWTQQAALPLLKSAHFWKTLEVNRRKVAAVQTPSDTLLLLLNAGQESKHPGQGWSKIC